MVTTAIREAVDALSAEERVSLLEYLERTTNTDDVLLTDEAIAVLDRRDAEMDADPSIGIPADEFFRQVRAEFL